MHSNPKITDSAHTELRPFHYPAQCLALGLAYFVLATFSIHLSHAVPDHVAAVWWPNALMLGVLLRSPTRQWWGFAGADLIANIAANIVMGYHPLLSPALALSDMVELGTCLWLLRGGPRHWRPMHNVRDFARTIAVVLGVGATLSATLAATLMHHIINADFFEAWRTWWMAECVGMISLLPLAVSASRQQLLALFRGRRAYEFLGISAASLLATFAALQQMPFPFIVMAVPLLLASLRLGVFGTALLGMANVVLVLLLALIFDNAPLATASGLIHAGSHLLFATALALVAPQMIALLIEQRDRTLSRLRQSEQIFRDSMEYAPIGMVLTGLDGICFSANPACCEILGFPPETLAGTKMSALCPPEEMDAVRALSMSVINGERTHASIERRYIRKDGSHVWCQMSIAAARDGDGNFLHMIAQIENIDERKRHERQREQLQRELEHRARHDSLTGLINRQAFEHALENILANTHNDNRQHSVCFIDLDRFKILNDSAGHAAGDLLLRQIGQRLLRRIRTHDVIARLGGDEFGLLLPDCGSEDAQRICENLIATINAIQFNWQGRLFNVGASIGVVPFRSGSMTIGELLSRADVACYSAKNAGRNRVAIYEGGDSAAARDHHQIQIAASIREALEAGRFCVYAQRITPLNPAITARPIEMLVRLRTREGQLLAPGAFIPAAERYDLMPAIDRWVIAHALLEHGAELASLDDVGVSINLSGSSFNDPEFADFLRAVIRNTPIRHGRICFEVTETAVVNNISETASLLRMLQDEGCKVALDDFGNGLSSFNYLKNFPADLVKIDGGFVRTLCDSDIDRAIVESINQIAHHIGAYTVAEYVETAEIAEKLRSMGVDFAQGYHFSKPEPLAAVLKLLAQESQPRSLAEPTAALS